MKNYKRSNFIFEKYQAVTPLRVDRLLLLEASDKVKREIPFTDIMAQFKYCIENDIRDEAYEVLLRLLEEICSVQEMESVVKRINGNKR